MSINQAESTLDKGSLALVTYLPDPLGSFLTELRQRLPSRSRPEAHITFLPPRSLSLSTDAASSEIRQILSAVEAFELELGVLSTFPGTNMLYLSVEKGSRELLALHNALNTGKLFADERYDYIPHLTLSDSLTESEMPEAFERTERAWNASGHPRSFVVNEIILLWQPNESSARSWTRIDSFQLSTFMPNGLPQAASG